MYLLKWLNSMKQRANLHGDTRGRGPSCTTSVLVVWPTYYITVRLFNLHINEQITERTVYHPPHRYKNIHDTLWIQKRDFV